DHILYGFLLVVLMIGVYTTALLLSEIENVLLAFGSPLAVLVALATFFYGVTELNTKQHVARERTRTSTALYYRAQKNKDLADKENARRCNRIQKRFDELFNVVGLLGLPLLAVHKWLSGLLVQGAEPAGIIWQSSLSMDDGISPPVAAKYEFFLNGFED